LNSTEYPGEAFTNSGNAPGPVKLQVVNGGGGANITQVEFANASTFSGAKQKITWTGTLGAGETLIIYPFKLVRQSSTNRGTIKVLRKAWPEIDGVNSGQVQVEGYEVPWVDEEASDQDFRIKLTGNSVSSTVTASWFDSYLS